MTNTVTQQTIQLSKMVGYFVTIVVIAQKEAV